MSEQDAGAGRHPYGRLRELLGGGRARAKAVVRQPIDPLITSRGLDGEEPRLRRRSTVPAVHLLRAAVVTGRTPGEVAARLTELGYRTPDVPPEDAVHPDDRRLISWRHDGRPSWLLTDRRVAFQHVLVAALGRGTAPREVAARLGELGYQVARIRLPESVEPHDPVLISRDLDGGIPWLPAGGKVTAGHLLRAAVATGLTSAEIAERLKELGFRVPAVPPAAEIRPGDRMLMSRNLDGKAPWRSPGVSVDVDRLLATAVAADSTPKRVADRLRELGYQIVKDPLPTIAQPQDTLLISQCLDGQWPALVSGQKVTAGHLLRAAAVTGQAPAEIADRLSELGFPVAEVPAADAVRPGDRRLISRKHDGKPPWLGPALPVSLGWLLSAALATGTAPAEVAARLRHLGYRVPKFGLPAEVGRPDLRLASQDLDGRAPWLPDTGTIVPVGHILRAAVARRREPAEVRTRLAELGFRVPKLPPGAAVQPTDRKLISSRSDGQPPWLDPDLPVQLGRLFAAALATGIPPRATAARLGELGYHVAEVRFPAAIEQSDLLLVSSDLNGREPWLSHFGDPPAGHLVRAAIATGQEVDEIAARLGELGFRQARRTPPFSIHPTDRRLISEGHDGKAPWLPAASPLRLGRILASALALDTTPGEVAARLAELGYELPAVRLPARAEPADLLLLSWSSDGKPPWIDEDYRIPEYRLRQLATATGTTREQLVGRLAELGYRIA